MRKLNMIIRVSVSLVPRRLSLDENLHAKEGGKEKTASPPFFTLPVVPCFSSPVTRVSRSPLCETMRKTKRLRRRLGECSVENE